MVRSSKVLAQGSIPACDGAAFHLDREQRAQVQGAIRSAGLKLTMASVVRMIQNIEKSIQGYLVEEIEAATEGATATFLALRKLYGLANDPDPPVGQIRALIAKLPKHALANMEIGAGRTLPRMFGEYAYGGNFRDWSKKVPADVLVDAVRILVSHGGQMVPGRARPGGKRSVPHYEPRILGRAAKDAPKKGRPPNRALFKLVAQTGHDWLLATGVLPVVRRGDKLGFAGLVHSIFQWLGLEVEEATYALRKYAATIKAIRAEGYPYPDTDL